MRVFPRRSWNGSAVSFTTKTIKGIAYATFEAPAGTYQASYGGGGSPTLSINGDTVTERNAGSVTAPEPVFP
jgi:hypothetical protein